MAVDRGAFLVVDQFERRLEEYTGAPQAVAVDSCTNALFLAFRLRMNQAECREDLGGAIEGRELWLPKRTYAGVYQAARNAGYRVSWKDEVWVGQYMIQPIMVLDAARRFTSGMYVSGSLQCLSFQATKILPIGRGGAILCEESDAIWLRKARFDGRDQEVSLYEQEEFSEGWHMYMPPDAAARGLWLMGGIEKHNADQEATYPDLEEKVWT